MGTIYNPNNYAELLVEGDEVLTDFVPYPPKDFNLERESQIVRVITEVSIKPHVTGCGIGVKIAVKPGQVAPPCPTCGGEGKPVFDHYAEMQKTNGAFCGCWMIWADPQKIAEYYLTPTRRVAVRVLPDRRSVFAITAGQPQNKHIVERAVLPVGVADAFQRLFRG